MFDSWVVWALLAAILVVGELLTGTFYLLMLALGACAGVLLALSDAAVWMQVGAASMVALISTFAWHRRKEHSATSLDPSRNPDLHVDIGSEVTVDSWHDGGTSMVTFRGVRWAARWVGEGSPSAGVCSVRGVAGNVLHLGPTSAI